MPWIKYLIFILLCVSPAYGQEAEDSIPISLSNYSVLGRTHLEDRHYHNKPETKILETPQSERYPNLNFYSELDLKYSPTFPDYWTQLANQPRRTVIVQYKGLHGIIYDQVERQAKKKYRSWLRDYWQQSYLHPMDLDARIRNYYLRSSDFGNRYWERRQNFWDYLPVNRGGASVIYHQIGSTHEIFSLGPITVKNTGKIKWSGWRLSVSSEEEALTTEEEIEDEKFPRLDRSGSRQRRRVRRRLALGIIPPRGNLYNGRYFIISGSIKLSLRLKDKLSENNSRIEGQLEITGLHSLMRIPWINAEIEAEIEPFTQQYEVKIAVSLLRW